MEEKDEDFRIAFPLLETPGFEATWRDSRADS
jgi:hypothetical protein